MDNNPVTFREVKDAIQKLFILFFAPIAIMTFIGFLCYFILSGILISFTVIGAIVDVIGFGFAFFIFFVIVAWFLWWTNKLLDTANWFKR